LHGKAVWSFPKKPQNFLTLAYVAAQTYARGVAVKHLVCSLDHHHAVIEAQSG
jgi:hypothetical protein